MPPLKSNNITFIVTITLNDFTYFKSYMKAQVEGGACCEAHILPESIKLLAIGDTRVVTGMGGKGRCLQ